MALGNGVVGILAESCSKWERRVPLTPSHCARLLNKGNEVARIVVQPSTKRIFHDSMYEDVGCEISEDLSECGLIVGVKQPKLEMILPDRAYAFFSHTHKAQKENMLLLDKILAKKASLYDYELIVGDHAKRLLAFGKYAGRAGLVDFLHGLGQRYLSLGFSTPFLSLGSSYMYPSLAAAKAAVISVAEEISTLGLPSGICPLVFVFTGSGNVSQGAQEIFKLLPHTFVDPSRLPELFAPEKESKTSERVYQVYGCVVTSKDMVEPADPALAFDKEDYYAHPEHYKPIFHEKICPYASVIVNCMYWEEKFPRLLSTQQLQDLTRKGCHLIGIADITCDIGGSIEFINQNTSIDFPFFRYDPLSNSYHDGMEGNGIICSSVDILPTQFAKEASQHFGDILSQFVSTLASTSDITELPSHLRRACIAHAGSLTPLFEYIPRMLKSDTEEAPGSLVNLQSSKNNLTSVGTKRPSVLIVGAGRVCRPAVEFLSSSRFEEQNDVHVIVASLFLKDALEIVDGISNATAVQLDITDNETLCKYIAQVEVVISLLPPSCHIIIANACIQLRKHLVTASYVDDSMSALDAKAKAADITILGEMGLDPGLDHMAAMKMINDAHARMGIIKSFTSYCGALPSPAAVNNPLAYKFSWSPTGAIRAGRNPATYKSHGKIVHVEGNKLYDSAVKVKIPHLPAFALECLPNRDSLVYSKVYGIQDAATIFRGTLRYQGFGKIMGTFARIGFFNTEPHPLLGREPRPTFRKFLEQLLNFHVDQGALGEKDVAEQIVKLGHCDDEETAVKAAKTIITLGLHEETEIPATCENAFYATCLRMEEKLTYAATEQDMVLLHHELEVEFPDNRPTEYHSGTLLEFGTTKSGKPVTAMAITVGVTAAIGALLLLENKIKTRGVLRPIEPEVYLPALDILQAQGIKLKENIC